MTLLYLTFAALMLTPLYLLWVTVQAHEARLKALEARKQDPEKRVQVPEKPQQKQIFEKPIVKNSKEVKPLEIGDGKMRFDAEAQVAEWV